jgi:hypothetical protein
MRMRRPRLFAFDLDGTLLASDKSLSETNRRALLEMTDFGAIVAFASGRLGSSVMQYARGLGLQPALLSLNGATVYKSEKDGGHLVFSMPLPARCADVLIDYARGKDFAVNYYIDDRLYSVRSPGISEWNALYYKETKTVCNFVDTLDGFKGRDPLKMLFIGDPKRLDEEEKKFRSQWDHDIYIVRTWDFYLEFMHRNANKGTGLTALAEAYGIDIGDTVAFGDADNDIPMLQQAGLGIAMGNALDSVKAAAKKISSWTNDENGVAREWELLKREFA